MSSHDKAASVARLDTKITELVKNLDVADFQEVLAGRGSRLLRFDTNNNNNNPPPPPPPPPPHPIE